MKTEVKSVAENEVLLEVEVPQEEVQRSYERTLKRLAREVSLPGFRKGKVPLPLAKKYISEDGLGGDVVDDLVPHAYHEALIQEKAFDWLDAPIERVGACFAPLPFSPVLEKACVPRRDKVYDAIMRSVGRR